MLFGPVHFKIAEKVVAGHEIVGIRQPSASGLSGANVALGANRRHHSTGILPFLGEVDQRRVLGVFQSDITMTGIAV